MIKMKHWLQILNKRSQFKVEKKHQLESFFSRKLQIQSLKTSILHQNKRWSKSLLIFKSQFLKNLNHIEITRSKIFIINKELSSPIVCRNVFLLIQPSIAHQRCCYKNTKMKLINLYRGLMKFWPQLDSISHYRSNTKCLKSY